MCNCCSLTSSQARGPVAGARTAAMRRKAAKMFKGLENFPGICACPAAAPVWTRVAVFPTRSPVILAGLRSEALSAAAVRVSQIRRHLPAAAQPSRSAIRGGTAPYPGTAQSRNCQRASPPSEWCRAAVSLAETRLGRSWPNLAAQPCRSPPFEVCAFHLIKVLGCGLRRAVAKVGLRSAS